MTQFFAYLFQSIVFIFIIGVAFNIFRNRRNQKRINEQLANSKKPVEQIHNTQSKMQSSPITRKQHNPSQSIHTSRQQKRDPKRFVVENREERRNEHFDYANPMSPLYLMDDDIPNRNSHNDNDNTTYEEEAKSSSRSWSDDPSYSPSPSPSWSDDSSSKSYGGGSSYGNDGGGYSSGGSDSGGGGGSD